MAVKRSPAWVGAMRKGLMGQNGEGWTLRDIRGRIQLTVRFEDGQRTSLVLDLPWAGTSQLASWYLEALTPGWGYLVEVNGLKVMRPGWPTADLLARHLGLDGGPPAYLAIRPSSQTRWVAIDVDQARSPHHPDRGEAGLENLLERLAVLGLRKPLIFQSSISRGLHLWFPLKQPQQTFEVALSIQHGLQAGAIDAGELGETLDFAGIGRPMSDSDRRIADEVRQSLILLGERLGCGEAS